LHGTSTVLPMMLPVLNRVGRVEQSETRQFHVCATQP
jgi:hypothetical protein